LPNEKFLKNKNKLKLKLAHISSPQNQTPHTDRGYYYSSTTRGSSSVKKYISGKEFSSEIDKSRNKDSG
jgi:hypothetical protein